MPSGSASQKTFEPFPAMTTPDDDPSDRLIDSLLREQARHRAADPELLASIEDALDSRGQSAMKKSPSHLGLLFASAAAVLLAAGGIALWSNGHGRESAASPALAMEPALHAERPRPAAVPGHEVALPPQASGPVPGLPDLAPPADSELAGNAAADETSSKAIASAKVDAAPAAGVPPNALTTRAVEEAAPSVNAGNRTIPVRFLAWDESLVSQKIMVMKDKERGQLIRDLHSLNLSINYQVAANEPLKLYPEGKSNPDGSPAILDVPLNGFTKPLVIIIPNDKVSSGLAAIAIEDNEANFKWGSYMVFNATREDLVMVVDKVPTKIPVGFKPVSITPKNINGPASIELRPVKDLKRVVYLESWQGAEDVRRLAIIVPGKDTALGGYVLKIIPEEKIKQDQENAGLASQPAVPLPKPEPSLAPTVDPLIQPLPSAEIASDSFTGSSGGAGGGAGGGIGKGVGPGGSIDAERAAKPAPAASIDDLADASAPPSTGGKAKSFFRKDMERQPGGDFRRGIERQSPDGTERYGSLVDQPWKSPWQDALSTFSIDVDSASYTNLRRMIRSGVKIPADSVRIEECLNYFDYGYEGPKNGGPFAVQGTLVTSPLQAGHLLARVAIKGREIENEARPACNLVFLIDVSGSMQPSNRLPLIQRGLSLLIDQLDEKDQVGIVVYAGNEGVVLDSTRLTEEGKQRAHHALKNLEAGGSTNGGAGIRRAYQIAAAHFISGGVNRVILATDGDFNVGTTGQSDLVDLVKEKATTGVNLTVTSVGEGNLNDSLLEAITKDGNGNYYYLDSDNEARRIFLQKLTGTLVTIAKDVKIQVEFNPGKVQAYRLLGYADRILKHEDFNNDKVDAGDIGAGHTVTAFYEIVPAGAEMPNLGGVDALKYQKPAGREIAPSEDWFTLKLRYKAPDGDVSSLIETPVKGDPQAWEQAGSDMRFASAVALFGMKLRDMPEAKEVPWSRVIELAKPALSNDPHEQRAEFIELVKKLAK
jgi:Ca-activated chloride channel family protein